MRHLWPVRRGASTEGVFGRGRAGWVLLLLLAAVFPQLKAQTYVISAIAPSTLPAGVTNPTLTLSGTLPNFALGTFQACFYAGSTVAAITPVTTTFGATMTVPAATLQGMASSLFTAANNYSYPATVYVVTQGTSCTGTPDPTLTNTVVEPVIEPVVGGFEGSLNVPQTNMVTGIQPPPTSITVQGSEFIQGLTYATLGGAPATAAITSPTTMVVTIPASFSSSAVGTTASVAVCNPNGGGGFCNGAGPAITLTVTAPVPSMGTLTATPTPTTTVGTTTATAQFLRSTTGGLTLPEPGAPSGTVTFAANGSTLGTAPLVLDSTAKFVANTTTTTVPTSPAPTIQPPAGTYAGAQSITITDINANATIFYTTDGTTPTMSSTVYSGPVTVSTSETVTAIAYVNGDFVSAPVAAAYNIFVPIPTSVAFVQQPTTAATGTAIAPPVTVAILDQNMNVITTSSAAVTVAIATNPGNGTLAGTTTVNAVNGIATFSNLSIASIANGYTLSAQSGTLARAASSAFNITPPLITVTLFAPLVGVTTTLPGTITLGVPGRA